MNSSFKISFASEGLARKAKSALTFGEISKKSRMKLTVKGVVLKAEIKAKTFSSLRARSTSFLRDVKIFLDSVSIVEKKR